MTKLGGHRAKYLRSDGIGRAGLLPSSLPSRLIFEVAYFDLHDRAAVQFAECPPSKRSWWLSWWRGLPRRRSMFPFRPRTVESSTPTRTDEPIAASCWLMEGASISRVGRSRRGHWQKLDFASSLSTSVVAASREAAP